MALTYKKLSELTDMTSANIDTTTKLVVTTGSTKVNNNLKVTDLIVDDLVTNNQYRALSAKQGKKLEDEKAPILNPAFQGTVSGINKAMVGLGNVDNTSDANKPVSTATQTQLNLKANLASPTFTGTVALPAANTLGTSTTKPATEAAVRSVLQSSNVRIIDVYDGDGYDLNSLDGTVFVNLTAGQDSLVRLPSGAGAGIKLTIKVVGVATVGLSSNTDSAETIDGVNVIATPIELAQNDSITVVGDGSNWYAIGTY